MILFKPHYGLDHKLLVKNLFWWLGCHFAILATKKNMILYVIAMIMNKLKFGSGLGLLII